jgi:hypothetical protein
MFRGLGVPTLFVCLSLVAAAPAAAAKRFTIDTTPVKQGRVFIDGEFVGVAPVEVELKLRKHERAVVTVEKVGALGLWEREITTAEKGTVYVRLEENAALDETVESDIANTWLTITPKLTRGSDNSVNEDAVWQKIVSVVTDNFADLEQLDRSSFYLRTAWRVRRYPHSILRNRVVIKRGVTDQLSVRVQLESFEMVSATTDANIADDLFTETSRIFLDDKETIDFLRDQL